MQIYEQESYLVSVFSGNDETGHNARLHTEGTINITDRALKKYTDLNPYLSRTRKAVL